MRNEMIVSNNMAPIGMIDSGLGGLSLYRVVRSYLPNENIIYLADSLNVPYGDKSKEWILNRSIELIQFLVEQKNCKIIVIACNTITAVAIEKLRNTFKTPIVAIEPAIKLAISLSKNKKIAVLATLATVNGDNVSNLIKKYAFETNVLLVPCIGLAEKIEMGKVETKEVRNYISHIIQDIFEVAKDTDIIVLGCTHYPFIAHIIQGITAGSNIKIIDPSEAVTKQLIKKLETLSLSSSSCHLGIDEIFTSSDTKKVMEIAYLLLGKKFNVTSIY